MRVMTLREDQRTPEGKGVTYQGKTAAMPQKRGGALGAGNQKKVSIPITNQAVDPKRGG